MQELIVCFHNKLVFKNTINISYLRGLEIAELKEEDMPMV
jgi:hypothetical protein